MKKWLVFSSVLALVSPLFGAESSATETGWAQLDDAALARAQKVASQNSDPAGKSFGCGPNQISRICAVNGIDYPYTTALTQAARNEGEFLAVHCSSDPSLCVGPTCRQMARHLNHALEGHQYPDGYRAVSEAELDVDAFIAAIRNGIRQKAPVIVMNKVADTIQLPTGQTLNLLHYLTVVGISPDDTQLKVLDTDGCVREEDFSTFVENMNTASTADLCKSLIELRVLAKVFGFNIARQEDVQSWEGYSYVVYGNEKEATLPPAPAPADNCSIQ